jgi:hypothetical protein
MHATFRAALATLVTVGVATAILIHLQLKDVIDWNWGWVFTPVWVLVALMFARTVMFLFGDKDAKNNMWIIVSDFLLWLFITLFFVFLAIHLNQRDRDDNFGRAIAASKAWGGDGGGNGGGDGGHGGDGGGHGDERTRLHISLNWVFAPLYALAVQAFIWVIWWPFAEGTMFKAGPRV